MTDKTYKFETTIRQLVKNMAKMTKVVTNCQKYVKQKMKDKNYKIFE